MKLVPVGNLQTPPPPAGLFGRFLPQSQQRASADNPFSLPDPVSERRVGEQDLAPAQEKPTSPGRAPEKKAKDDSRRVAKSAQDLSDVSMDEVGIPLRVRTLTQKSFIGFLLHQ